MRRTVSMGVLVAAVATLVAGNFVGSAAGGEASICSTVDRYHLEQQLNLRAEQILRACGRTPVAPPEQPFSALDQLAPSSPNVYGGADVDLFLSAFSHIIPSQEVGF